MLGELSTSLDSPLVISEVAEVENLDRKQARKPYCNKQICNSNVSSTQLFLHATPSIK